MTPYSKYLNLSSDKKLSLSDLNKFALVANAIAERREVKLPEVSALAGVYRDAMAKGEDFTLRKAVAAQSLRDYESNPSIEKLDCLSGAAANAANAELSARKADEKHDELLSSYGSLFGRLAGVRAYVESERKRLTLKELRDTISQLEGDIKDIDGKIAVEKDSKTKNRLSLEKARAASLLEETQKRLKEIQ